jgi:hypothetical protein
VSARCGSHQRSRSCHSDGANAGPERTYAEVYDRYDIFERTLAADGHPDVALGAAFGLTGPVNEDARLKALYAAFKILGGGQ